MKETNIIPVHQWTNGGNEVLVVRFVSQDGKSYGGFQHPMIVGETVTAPDWKANCNCGGGIHAWPWALGLGEGKDCDWTALWQVYGVKPEDIMQGEPELIGKVKFRAGVLRFVGKWWEATNYVLSGQMAWVHHSAWGSASSTGAMGSASSTGAMGSASSTGAMGSASSTGWSGSASSTGKYGTSVALGIESKASGSLGNFLVIAEWKYINNEWKRVAMGLAKVDGKKIKSDTFYTLKDGKFVEATS
jgi:hypothetical protein